MRHANAVTGPQERRVRQRERRRQQSAAQQLLPSVQIEQDQVEQPRALRQSFLEVTPVRRRDQERHHVELPGPIHALGVAVDVVGDAVLADGAARVVAARRELVRAERLEALDERVTVRPQRACRRDHLVERAADRVILLQETPRHRRPLNVGDRAHLNPSA